ncbi:MAG: hypothetical protein ABIS17_04160 [Casimicrobiaceae bacterium]
MADLCSRGIGDVVLALALLALSGVTFVGSLGLPPPTFNPPGSPLLPKALAVILALLSIGPMRPCNNGLSLHLGAFSWSSRRAAAASHDQNFP